MSGMVELTDSTFWETESSSVATMSTFISSSTGSVVLTSIDCGFGDEAVEGS